MATQHNISTALHGAGERTAVSLLTTGSVMLNPRTIENINSENQNKEGIPIAVNATSDPGPLQQVEWIDLCFAVF